MSSEPTAKELAERSHQADMKITEIKLKLAEDLLKVVENTAVENISQLIEYAQAASMIRSL